MGIIPDLGHKSRVGLKRKGVILLKGKMYLQEFQLKSPPFSPLKVVGNTVDKGAHTAP